MQKEISGIRGTSLWAALKELGNSAYPGGPNTQYLSTWDLGNSTCDAGFGTHLIVGYLDP